MKTSRLNPQEDLRNYRAALGSFGTGVAVVTAAFGEDHLGMTINSFASVSLQPALVLWSVGDRAANYQQFCEVERYAIHILAVDQREVSDRFALTGGNKFENVDWELDDAGVPRIRGCLARFQCRRFAVYPGGDHQIVVGEVEQFELAAGEPLLFVQGCYLEMSPAAIV